MEKIIVILYHSAKGSTRKTAQAVAEGLGTGAVSIEDFHPSTLADIDLLVLGSPVYGDLPSDQIKKFLDENQIWPSHAAIFCTHAATYDMPDSPSACLDYMAEKLQEKGSRVISRFSVRGENSDQSIIEWLRVNMPERVAGALSSKGHPDTDELERATRWGQSLYRHL
jgi:flavodoxin